MKVSKKFLSVLLMVCLVLTMSAPAFAATTTGSTVDVMYIPAYDESVTYGMVNSGTLDDGTEYWVVNLTPTEVVHQQSLRSYDWSDKVSVPIMNHDGTNGATLGYSFTAYPDSYVVVTVGNLPSNMPSVNLAFYYENGSDSDWTPNIGSNSMVVFKLNYPSNEGRVKVSTQEDASKIATFSFYTSDTNPADDYIEV